MLAAVHITASFKSLWGLRTKGPVRTLFTKITRVVNSGADIII